VFIFTCLNPVVYLHLFFYSVSFLLRKENLQIIDGFFSRTCYCHITFSGLYQNNLVELTTVNYDGQTYLKSEQSLKKNYTKEYIYLD
jgi:hypothetical protein